MGEHSSVYYSMDFIRRLYHLVASIYTTAVDLLVTDSATIANYRVAYNAENSNGKFKRVDDLISTKTGGYSTDYLMINFGIPIIVLGEERIVSHVIRIYAVDIHSSKYSVELISAAFNMDRQHWVSSDQMMENPLIFTCEEGQPIDEAILSLAPEIMKHDEIQRDYMFRIRQKDSAMEQALTGPKKEVDFKQLTEKVFELAEELISCELDLYSSKNPEFLKMAYAVNRAISSADRTFLNRLKDKYTTLSEEAK